MVVPAWMGYLKAGIEGEATDRHEAEFLTDWVALY
jgi:hypothetical protein